MHTHIKQCCVCSEQTQRRRHSTADLDFCNLEGGNKRQVLGELYRRSRCNCPTNNRLQSQYILRCQQPISTRAQATNIAVSGDMAAMAKKTQYSQAGETESSGYNTKRINCECINKKKTTSYCSFMVLPVSDHLLSFSLSSELYFGLNVHSIAGKLNRSKRIFIDFKSWPNTVFSTINNYRSILLCRRTNYDQHHDSALLSFPCSQSTNDCLQKQS